MAQDKKHFRHESLQDRDSIQQLLKAVTRGVAKGKLSFSDEDGEIAMEPKGLMRVKITADSEENRHRISLRINWLSEEEEPKKQRTLNVTDK
jgi:amphi-Trp domain-containing protein